MASSILSIGQSALTAAQVGLSTTGHNIANASTPGYSRQVVVQATAIPQNFSFGYIGQGTQISTISRVYSDVLAKQISTSQSLSSQLDTYATQLGQIDNLLADSSAGLSPALQDFFNSLQTLSSNPGDAPTRQSVLSAAQSLASRFQSLGGQLDEIRQGINSQLTSSVSLVNTYAQQLAQLNDAIGKAQSVNGQPPNDLLDQRDQVIADLSKLVKTSVVNQDGTTYNVFIGNGQPLVLGTQAFSLTTTNSPTDPSQLEVAYNNNNKVTILGQDSLAGGSIGGLLQFRSESLDSIQNKLGQIATVLARTFNDQHEQALDANGVPGGNFFTPPSPLVNQNANNTGNANLTADIVDAKALTGSDYRVQFDGGNYNVTRISDGQVQSFSSLPQTLDGLNIDIASGAFASGDSFLVRPTFTAASTFSVAISNINKIAAGGPALTSSAIAGNTGTASISAPSVTNSYAASPLTSPLVLTYNSAGNTLSGFPAGQSVTLTVGSTSTTYSAGSTVPYVDGATISVAGLNTVISGAPNDGDQFSISPNSTNGPGDNRNSLLLAALRTAGTLNGNTSYENAFGQLVSAVGNKTRELQVTSAAESQLLSQAVTAQQSESGVNLDEEATNLLRYQQAYQAAGKIMQIASTMFDTLLQLGR